jgi:hypothetical protein
VFVVALAWESTSSAYYETSGNRFAIKDVSSTYNNFSAYYFAVSFFLHF